MNDFEQLSLVFEQEAKWLSLVIKYRLKNFIKPCKTIDEIYAVKINDFESIQTNYTDFILKNHLCFEERLLLALTIIPHIKPHFLIHEFREYGFADSDDFYPVKRNYPAEFPEIGLSFKENAVIPTGLTFLFLVSGRNIEQRLKAALLLQGNTTLIKEKVIYLEEASSENVFYSGKLIFSKAYFDVFTSIQNVNLKGQSHADERKQACAKPPGRWIAQKSRR